MHTMEESVSHKLIFHATPAHRWRSNQHDLFLNIKIDEIQVHAHTPEYIHRKYRLTELSFLLSKAKMVKFKCSHTHAVGRHIHSWRKKTCLKNINLNSF